MLGAKRPSSRSFAVWASSLIALVLAHPGCQPEGAGSIKMGSRSQWHKEPEAPAARAKAKKATSRTIHEKPGSQEPFKSIKDQMRERGSGAK
jgi:hypothetical protein